MMIRGSPNLASSVREMEDRVRKLKESLGIPPDQYPVDILGIASALGVKVYDAEFHNPNISGMVITDRKRVPEWVTPGERATIFVAKGEYPPRKAFTIAHELGHVVLGHVGGEGLRTDLFRGQGLPYDPQAEREANLFAAALLMPEEPFRQVCEAFAGRGIHYVAALFGVSVNAAAVRARELGLEVPLF